MKVLALIESADHVCFRYRLNALAWPMAESNLFLEARVLGRGWRRMLSLVAARRADIVILQRKLLPRWQLAILRQNARCLVYDIDDALFRRDSFSRKGCLSPARLARFRRTVRMADAVLAGNRYLQHFAAAHTAPDRMHYVPTCIEPGSYTPSRHQRRGPMARLAWIGQRSMLPSLDAIHDHLAAAAGRVPGLTLQVISDSLPSRRGMPMQLRPWSSATEAQELAAADIGISWLTDDPWSLGKCGLKVLQYMAAGLPVVANPVGVHEQMVIHGETGYLASTPQDWADALRYLAENPDVRQRMGAAARRLVERHYSVGVWGPRLAEILSAAVASRPLRLERLEPRVNASPTTGWQAPMAGESRSIPL